MDSTANADARHRPGFQRGTTKAGSLLTTLSGIFYLDPRSLALFRILLGGILCVKILHLWPNLGLVLADDGLLPRSLLAGNTTPPWHFLSVYTWVSSSEGIHFLAVVNLVLAVAFALGWKTRWVTPLLWFFTVSLNMRNPMILNGGDKVMTTFLFWAMFLPLSATLAIDARRKAGVREKPARSLVTAFGSTCFILQLVIIYVFSGYAKSHPIWIFDFDALECALRNEAYVRPLGTQLLQYPGLLKVLTVATLYLEQLLVLLVLSPYFPAFFRTTIPLLFIAFHSGIALTLDVGLFSPACMAAWVALLPPSALDWIQRKLTVKRSGVRPPAPNHALARPLPYILSLALMAYLIAGSAAPGKKETVKRALTQPIRSLKLTQSWSLYAPHPSFSTRWFAILATTDHEQPVIVYPPSEQKFLSASEEDIPKSYPAFYLRKYFYILARKADSSLIEAAFHGFRNYWLPTDHSSPAEWKLVCWKRIHHPKADPVFTKQVLYPPSRHQPLDQDSGEKTLEDYVLE